MIDLAHGEETSGNAISGKTAGEETLGVSQIIVDEDDKWGDSWGDSLDGSLDGWLLG